MADRLVNPAQRNEASAAAYAMSKEVPIAAPQDEAGKSRVKRAAKAWDRVKEGRARQGLEIIAQPEYDRAQIDLRIDQFGVQRDARGNRVLTRYEQGWRDDAKADATLISKVLEGQYRTADVTEAQRTQIRLAVVDAITRNPDIARGFYSLNPNQDPRAPLTPEQMIFIDNHISDPRFMREIRRGMEALSKTPEFQDGYTDAALDLAAKARERRTAVEELHETERQMQQVQRRIDAFDRTGMQGPGFGERAREINGAQEQLREARGRLTELRGNREDLEDQIATYRERLPNYPNRNDAERVTLQTQISDAENGIRQIDRRIKRAQAEITELGTVNVAGTANEEVRLEDRMAELRRERAQKQERLDQIDADIQRGVITVQDAIRAREAAEQAFAGKLRSIWGDAATVIANEDLALINTEMNRVLDEEEGEIKSKAADAGKKTIRSVLETKVVKSYWGKRVERTIINKAEARRYSSLLIDEGPEAMAFRLLGNTIDPETGQKYTPEQALALSKNKEFMREFEPIMAKEIFGKMLRTDKKGFTPEDTQQIIQAEWGQRMVDVAIAGNQELKDAAENLYGKGAASKPGFAKRLAREVGSKENLKTLSLLALIFGPVGIVAGLGNYAKKGYEAGQGHSPVFG